MIVPVFKTGGWRVTPSPVGSTPTRFRHAATEIRLRSHPGEVRLLPPVEAERLLVSSIILRRLNFDFDQQRSGLTRYCGKE